MRILYIYTICVTLFIFRHTPWRTAVAELCTIWLLSWGVHGQVRLVWGPLLALHVGSLQLYDHNTLSLLELVYRFIHAYSGNPRAPEGLFWHYLYHYLFPQRYEYSHWTLFIGLLDLPSPPASTPLVILLPTSIPHRPSDLLVLDLPRLPLC